MAIPDASYMNPLLPLLGSAILAHSNWRSTQPNLGKGLFDAIQTAQNIRLHQIGQQNQVNMFEEKLAQAKAAQETMANYRQQLLNLQMAKLSQLPGRFGAALTTLQRLPDDSRYKKLAQAYVNRLAQGPNGLSVTLPNGQVISVGGSAQPGTQGGEVVNPLTKGSRGFKGSTYTNTATGQAYSMPTNAQTTLLQQSNPGIVRAITQIDQLKPIANYQGLAGNVKGIYQMGKGYLLNEQTPASKAYYNYNETLRQVPESILRAFNIRPTVEAINEFKKSLAKGKYESGAGYLNRLNRTQQELLNFAKINSVSLNQGIPLNVNELLSMIDNQKSQNNNTQVGRPSKKADWTVDENTGQLVRTQ